MRPGWSKVQATGRWCTTWLSGHGYVCLNAFPSGAWSITSKQHATADNPHGILASSFHNDEVGPGKDLLHAMEIAARAAGTLGAVVMKAPHEGDVVITGALTGS